MLLFICLAFAMIGKNRMSISFLASDSFSKLTNVVIGLSICGTNRLIHERTRNVTVIRLTLSVISNYSICISFQAFNGRFKGVGMPSVKKMILVVSNKVAQDKLFGVGMTLQ